jgi:putative transposase
MPYNPEKHHRRSIRLPEYDYASPGAYFVTICVRGGECLLGAVVGDEMQRNQLGQIAHDMWLQLPGHFSNVIVDAFVVMPNHVHAIIEIQAPSDLVGEGKKGEGTSPLQIPRHEKDARRGAVAAPIGLAGPPDVPACAAPLPAREATLGQMVAYYKYQTTKHINELRTMPGVPFWQRNYWEHIVRDDHSLRRIRQYIEDNPARWVADRLHPAAPPNRFNQWPSG